MGLATCNCISFGRPISAQALCLRVGFCMGRVLRCVRVHRFYERAIARARATARARVTARAKARARASETESERDSARESESKSAGRVHDTARHVVHTPPSWNSTCNCMHHTPTQTHTHRRTQHTPYAPSARTHARTLASPSPSARATAKPVHIGRRAQGQ